MSPWENLPGETPIDTSGLKVKGVTTRAQLNVVEIENINRAMEKYLANRPTHRIAPFDYTWALALHSEMFGDVWQWAGVIRGEDLNIGVRWFQVREQLYELLENLKHWQQHDNAANQAALLHHRAVWIHPFPNGNGRWARLLTNIWLSLQRESIVLWPERTVGKKSVIRNDYLDALRAADAGDLSHLIELQEQYREG